MQFSWNIQKEGRLSSSHLGIQHIPSDVCDDDTKHYQVQSEHRPIQNTFKHLSRLLDTQKHSILDVWSGSEYTSAEKQVTRKVCKKNSRRRYVKCKSTWYAFQMFQWYKLTFDCAALALKIYELVLFKKIFVQLFSSSAGSFFLFFPSRRLPVIFDI